MAKMPDTNMTSATRNEYNTATATGAATAAAAAASHSSSGNKVILNPQDVLLGRGDWTVRYEGNVRFRDLIREKRDLFGAASGRSARDLVASDIIRIISERGGRFLRKEVDATVATTTTIGSSSSLLQEQEINQQLSHALREGESKQRTTSSGGETTVTVGSNEHQDMTSPIDGTWVVVDKKTAMKKVKQAFRDKDSWTQKVDTNPNSITASHFHHHHHLTGPQSHPSSSGFASMRIPTQASSDRHDAVSSLPSLLNANNSAVLPSPGALLANASLQQQQQSHGGGGISSGSTTLPSQSLLQSNAAMAENIHRLEFERTLMAAVQQQQQLQLRNIEARRLADLTRLRQLSSLGLMTQSGSTTGSDMNLNTTSLNPQQHQQLLASLRQQQQQQQHDSLDGANLGGGGTGTNLSQLQQHLLLMQQQQQQQQQRMELAMLLRARQNQEQDASLGAASSMAQQQQHALAIQQLRLKQLQQQQLQLSGLSGGGSGGQSHPTIATPSSFSRSNIRDLSNDLSDHNLLRGDVVLTGPLLSAQSQLLASYGTNSQATSLSSTKVDAPVRITEAGTTSSKLNTTTNVASGPGITVKDKKDDDDILHQTAEISDQRQSNTAIISNNPQDVVLDNEELQLESSRSSKRKKRNESMSTTTETSKTTRRKT